MNSQDRTLTAIAAVLLAVAALAASVSPVVCLASAICALALSLYLRHRGAFRSDNTPLLGALLIGGSAITVLIGALVFNPRAAFIVMGVVLIPTLLFLKVVMWRERLRQITRDIDGDTPDDEQPKR